MPLIEIELCGDSHRDLRHLRDAIHKLAHEVHKLIGVVHDLRGEIADLTDRVSSLENRVAVLEAGEVGEHPGPAVSGVIRFGTPRDK